MLSSAGSTAFKAIHHPEHRPGAEMSLTKRPSKQRIGYARVSTRQQDLTRQVQALKRERCDAILSDTAAAPQCL
jgi:predicted site-specific integrase-resolvase